MAAITTVLFAVLTCVCVARVGQLIYARGLSWFVRLPGDIRHRSVRTMVYIPVTSMLLLSLSLSLLVYLSRLVF
jgi:hypothetical protein